MPLLDQSLVDGVIKRALRSGADFVELFVERKRNQSISVEESKVQRVSSGNDLGAGLRIIHQGTVSYVYTEETDTKYMMVRHLTMKGQSRIWGYSLTLPGGNGEFSDIQVERVITTA